jgi:hypothetical protein
MVVAARRRLRVVAIVQSPAGGVVGAAIAG